ncbi:unnamed protein product [Ectocarpus sp. 6 AP-2014]
MQGPRMGRRPPPGCCRPCPHQAAVFPSCPRGIRCVTYSNAAPQPSPPLSPSSLATAVPTALQLPNSPPLAVTNTNCPLNPLSNFPPSPVPPTTAVRSTMTLLSRRPVFAVIHGAPGVTPPRCRSLGRSLGTISSGPPCPSGVHGRFHNLLRPFRGLPDPCRDEVARVAREP